MQGARTANSFLELGCWDGMVSHSLHRRGKETTAIDNREEGFDERARQVGVHLIKMDAARLLFENASFDFIFSYDSFEHFLVPAMVLKEAVRVLRPGGGIYLEFGPLYFSPYGLHAYQSITVPYCQFLFPTPMLTDFVAQKGLEPIDFDQVNGWSLEKFRALWANNASSLKCLKSHETLDLAHMNLIRAYPSCFRNKSDFFENFTVAHIQILFRKIAESS
jgi:SAM-dependent methyltransferase